MEEMDDDADASLSTPALLAACSTGGDIIVGRAPFRTGKLFAEELRAAAVLLGFASDQLRTLSPGLVLLLPSDAPNRARLLAWLDALGGVRISGSLVCAAADSAGLVKAALGARATARRAPRWDVTYEVHYPTADHSVVPFVRMHAAPELLIRLHQALGPDEYAPNAGDADEETLSPTAASAGVDRLVLLHCKHGLLLLSQRPLDRRAPADAAEVASSRGKRPCLETDRAAAAATPMAASSPEAEPSSSASAASAALALSEAACKSLPWWLAPWALRGFSFSSSLDPLIAIASLNLAASTHLARTDLTHAARPRLASGHGLDGSLRRGVGVGPLQGLRVYDPCCGSGTLLVAALAAGASAVAGSDLRAEFVEGATSNLEAMGLLTEGMPLFCHDAGADLPEGRLPPREAGSACNGGPLAWCDLVVSNPPWGKNCGKPEDGSPIVLSMCRQFRGVTMVLLINKFTRAVLEAQPPEVCVVHRVTKLGGVEAVLLTT